VMNGHDFLFETAALIREGWCSGADALDGAGQPVAVSAPAAKAWSLTGALARVSDRPNASLQSLSDALWGISGAIPDWSLDGWNNTPGRSQAQTLEMLADAGRSLTTHPPPSSGHLN
jgi:hypothetical protein